MGLLRANFACGGKFSNTKISNKSKWSPSLCMSHLDLFDIWVLENLPPQAKFALSSKLCLFYLVQYFNLLTYVWQSLMFSPASDFAIFIWTHPLPNLKFFGFTT